MSKLVIDLEDWDEIYDKYMKQIKKCIRKRKKELIDDTDDDYCVSALRDAYRWVDSDNQKCLLNNINTALKEKAHCINEKPVFRWVKEFNNKNALWLFRQFTYITKDVTMTLEVDDGELFLEDRCCMYNDIVFKIDDGKIGWLPRYMFEELYPNEPIE